MILSRLMGGWYACQFYFDWLESLLPSHCLKAFELAADALSLFLFVQFTLPSSL